MGLREFSLVRFESKILVGSPSTSCVWIPKRQYNHLTAHIFIFSLFVFYHLGNAITFGSSFSNGECRQLYPTLVLLLIPSRDTASQSLQFRRQYLDRSIRPGWLESPVPGRTGTVSGVIRNRLFPSRRRICVKQVQEGDSRRSVAGYYAFGSLTSLRSFIAGQVESWLKVSLAHAHKNLQVCMLLRTTEVCVPFCLHQCRGILRGTRPR